MVAESQLCWDINTWNHLNCVQTNDLYKLELLVSNSDTWNHFTVCEQMFDIK